MISTLWKDDCGAILSTEMVLIGSVVLLGVVAGLATVRDAVTTELANFGGSISNLDQSFVLHGTRSHSAATAGTRFVDAADSGDDPGDSLVINERCLVVCAGLPVVGPVGNEGTVIAAR
jgi:hypothetical protein